MNQGLWFVSSALQRRFYGPRERKMGLLAFLRVGVWMNGLRAFKNGFVGNVLGEGFVLGGVFVIGRGEQVMDYIKTCVEEESKQARCNSLICLHSLTGNTSGAQRN